MDGASAEQASTGHVEAGQAPPVQLRALPKSSPWNPPVGAAVFTAKRISPAPGGRCTVRNAKGEEINRHPCGRPNAAGPFPREMFLWLWGSGRYRVTFFQAADPNRVMGNVIIDVDDPAWPTKPCSALPIDLVALSSAQASQLSASPVVGAAPSAGSAHGPVAAPNASPPAFANDDEAAPTMDDEGDELEDDEGDEPEDDDDEAEFARLESENRQLKAKIAALEQPWPPKRAPVAA